MKYRAALAVPPDAARRVTSVAWDAVDDHAARMDLPLAQPVLRLPAVQPVPSRSV